MFSVRYEKSIGLTHQTSFIYALQQTVKTKIIITIIGHYSGTNVRSNCILFSTLIISRVINVKLTQS